MHFFVAKLLSIAVMTYSYIYDLTSAKPTSDNPANFYAHSTLRINFSMQYCFCVYAFPGIHTQKHCLYHVLTPHRQGRNGAGTRRNGAPVNVVGHCRQTLTL